MKTNGNVKLVMVLAGLLALSGSALYAATPLVEAMTVSVTNYPNPFDSRSEQTTILYSLAQDSQVRVAIYDLLGNLVKQYPSMDQAAGTVSIVWDGTNEANEKVAQGGYLVLVVANSASGTTQTIRKVGVLH